MFCPTCGIDSQSPNAYCKRCGAWLPDIKNHTRLTFGGETPQQNIFTNLFMSGISTLAALFAAIALYTTYLGGNDAKWSVYAAAAICVCIAGWQASSFVVGLKLRQRLKSGRESSTSVPEMESKSTAPALPAADMTDFVSAASVTENTTTLLDPVPSQKRDTRR